jgi:hypothetical protein
MNRLDAAGRGWSAYDKGLAGEYHRKRQATDRTNGDTSYLLKDTEVEDGEEDHEEDTDDHEEETEDDEEDAE